MKSDLPRQWFPPSQLAFYFDQGAWSRGTTLYLQNKVLSSQLSPDGEGWRLQGQVEGSEPRPYTVNAELRVSPGGNLSEWRSGCTCPVGRYCKHGAALGILASMQGLALLDEWGSEGPSAEVIERRSQMEKERALSHAEYQAREWLTRLENANRPKLVAMPGSTQDQFVYLLSVAYLGHKPLFQLSVKRAAQKRNGEWGKPKKISHEPSPHDPIWGNSTSLDRDIFDLMKACPAANSFSSYGFQGEVKLHGMPGQLLLQLCSQTGRLVSAEGAVSLQWSEAAEALVGAWQEVPAQDNMPGGWKLSMQPQRAGVVYGLNEPPFYMDTVQGHCGALNTQGLSANELQVMSTSPVLPESVVFKFQNQLLERLGPVPLPPVIAKMSEIRDVEARAMFDIVPVNPADRDQFGLFMGELTFDYAGQRGFWTGTQKRVMAGHGPQARMLVRDLPGELRAWNALDALGMVAYETNILGLPPQQSQQWLAWLETDFAPLRQAGLEVLFVSGDVNWLREADDVHIDLSGDADAPETSPWFDLSLGMDIDGQRVNILPWVPTILSALARIQGGTAEGETASLPPFLYLPDLQGEGFVKLPTAKIAPWLNTLMELVSERGRDWSGDELRLSRLEALRTAASLGEGVTWAGAQSLMNLVKQMHGLDSLPEVPAPASLQATLRPYQQQGLNWLQFLRTHQLAGILADDMGLGKTLQTLAHILTEKEAGRLSHPALIVAPVSLLGNWQREATRFCPSLRTHIHHGLSRHEAAQDLRGFDIVLTPYSLLHRDRELWLDAQWHLLVLDEAQNIKNANTHAAQTVGDIPATHRLCLSGTPMENHLGELWSLFHFLMPGFLGSQKRFGELFRNPIERLGNSDKMDQLRKRITPFMLRRTKDVVASELPPKVETFMPVPLQGKQADLYETIRLGMEKTVRDALNVQGLAKSQITILDALLKLRQVCCDPRLLKLGSANLVQQSAKLEQLLDMLPEMVAEGRKILLFSQFTQMLSLIEQELPRLGIPWVKLTGQSKNRDKIIDRFTNGQVPLFLISLKAGGVGLNLPQADTVIHYDPWWNPAVENQATDRAHRIGQTQSLWVLKLVAQGTIEERMLALQERKAQLAQDMYAGAVQRKEPLFGESDLNELFKPLG
ncbi:DEAD/DEAH box helicase [Limnohabitans sp. Hippo3]|uniref:DEAD/DEAH box helicase n=1 Tax=Limnohabitans sp. Hippo3 TaxID=1597956 RepID=UPI000D33B159|nr:DEAD/DEAH box helicase [Limnohabitans sp. Hippo3]PUE43564.1 helicase SNF2 [Limnohabitans sp. Hippo3]